MHGRIPHQIVRMRHAFSTIVLIISGLPDVSSRHLRHQLLNIDTISPASEVLGLAAEASGDPQDSADDVILAEAMSHNTDDSANSEFKLLKNQSTHFAQTMATRMHMQDDPARTKNPFHQIADALDKGRERLTRPLMNSINVMRAEFCLRRPDLMQHEKCLRFLLEHCVKESSGYGYCAEFLGMLSNQCEQGNVLPGESEHCELYNKLAAVMKPDAIHHHREETAERVEDIAEDEHAEELPTSESTHQQEELPAPEPKVQQPPEELPAPEPEVQQSAGDPMPEAQQPDPQSPVQDKEIQPQIQEAPSPPKGPTEPTSEDVEDPLQSLPIPELVGPRSSPSPAPAVAPPQTVSNFDKRIRALPEQGYDEQSHSKLVKHADFDTQTADWRHEWPSWDETESQSTDRICDAQPDHLWCRLWLKDRARAKILPEVHVQRTVHRVETDSATQAQSNAKIGIKSKKQASKRATEKATKKATKTATKIEAQSDAEKSAERVETGVDRGAGSDVDMNVEQGADATADQAQEAADRASESLPPGVLPSSNDLDSSEENTAKQAEEFSDEMADQAQEASDQVLESIPPGVLPSSKDLDSAGDNTAKQADEFNDDLPPGMLPDSKDLDASGKNTGEQIEDVGNDLPPGMINHPNDMSKSMVFKPDQANDSTFSEDDNFVSDNDDAVDIYAEELAK